MQSEPQPTMKKKSNTGLIIGLVVGAVLICCVLPLGGLIGFSFVAATKGQGMIGCTISMQVAAESVRQYTRDNGGKLPPEKNWEAALWPYFEQETKDMDDTGPFKLFQKGEPWGCDEGEMLTGFALNADLAGKNLKDIPDQRNAVVIFETKKRGIGQVQKYQLPPHSQSPSLLGGVLGKGSRGWFVVTADGQANLTDKNGRPKVLQDTSKGFRK
jgi:hypothetical protein